MDVDALVNAAGSVYRHWNKEQNYAYLRSCYTSSLNLAAANGCESIAFLLISSGISGTILKMDELTSALQACFDAEDKKVLALITSASDIGSVPSDPIGAFSLIFYNTPQEAVHKTQGVG
jgi:predicted ATP-dependent Lon-type protease